MQSKTYRQIVNALGIVASAAFAGSNLFIGLSIGVLWLSMDPLTWMNGFWVEFTRFSLTIIPLFLLTLVGLVLSVCLDWGESRLKRLWLIAIGLYIATSLITMIYHLPENLRLHDGLYSAAEAEAIRSLWLWLHVPRVVLAFGIPLVALRAVFERNVSSPQAE